jgi:hypothetical protein
MRRAGAVQFELAKDTNTAGVIQSTPKIVVLSKTPKGFEQADIDVLSLLPASNQTQLPPSMSQKVTRLPIRHQHVSRFMCHDRSCNGVSFKRFFDCELRCYAAALSSRQLP